MAFRRGLLLLLLDLVLGRHLAVDGQQLFLLLGHRQNLPA
jgi:hypothetical protein